MIGLDPARVISHMQLTVKNVCIVSSLSVFFYMFLRSRIFKSSMVRLICVFTGMILPISCGYADTSDVKLIAIPGSTNIFSQEESNDKRYLVTNTGKEIVEVALRSRCSSCSHQSILPKFLLPSQHHLIQVPNQKGNLRTNMILLEIIKGSNSTYRLVDEKSDQTDKVDVTPGAVELGLIPNGNVMIITSNMISFPLTLGVEEFSAEAESAVVDLSWKIRKQGVFIQDVRMVYKLKNGISDSRTTGVMVSVRIGKDWIQFALPVRIFGLGMDENPMAPTPWLIDEQDCIAFNPQVVQVRMTDLGATCWIVGLRTNVISNIFVESLDPRVSVEYKSAFLDFGERWPLKVLVRPHLMTGSSAFNSLIRISGKCDKRTFNMVVPVSVSQ